MKTVNRGWLRRQIAAGKVEARCNYRYTDDYAFDNATGFGQTGWMPARISTGYGDFVEGVMNFTEFDLKSSSGRAYWKDDTQTEIRLIVHSNESHTLRIKAIS